MNISLRRLRNQHLLGNPSGTAEEAVEWLGAVQSQDYGGAKWGLGQRLSNVTDADLDRAYDEGRILRTHILRPTWHFVSPNDIRWMLKLSAKRVHKVSAYYYRKCEISDPLVAKTNDLFVKALENHTYQTREELGEVLRQNGIEFDVLRLTYIVMCAELDAVICSGPRRGKQFTYALLDERASATKPFEGDEAMAMLARRYFQSHGPAQVQDFANWASLSVADAKHGVNLIIDELEKTEQDGKAFWHFASSEPAVPKKPLIHLLPNYDEHLIAYKDYAPSFDPEVYKNVNTSEVFLRAHLLTRNGKVIGGWRRTLSKKKATVEIMPIIELSEADRQGIAATAESYGRFLGVAAEVEYTG